MTRGRSAKFYKNCEGRRELLNLKKNGPFHLVDTVKEKTHAPWARIDLNFLVFIFGFFIFCKSNSGRICTCIVYVFKLIFIFEGIACICIFRRLESASTTCLLLFFVLFFCFWVRKYNIKLSYSCSKRR